MKAKSTVIFRNAGLSILFGLAFFLFAGQRLEGQTIIPPSDEIILPQFMVNGTAAGSRLQYLCRLKLEGLAPGATYRYYTGASTSTTIVNTTAPGNMFCINNTATSYGYIVGYTSQKGVGGSLFSGDEFNTTSGANRYGELIADGAGVYEGWFCVVPTGNAVFTAGNAVYFYVQINDGAGGTTLVNSYRTTSTILVLGPGADCAAIRGESIALGEAMVFLYDNTAGTGRPIYGTWTESDGITTNFTSWYATATGTPVDGITGSWGAYIPSSLPTGIERIESRDINNNLICGHTDSDGTWPSGVSTVDPAASLTPLVITSGDAALAGCGTVNLPTVSTDNITNIGVTTATGGGNVIADGGANVTARGVCWNTTGTPTISDPHTSNGTGTGTFVSSLTNLTQLTPYFVRAYATNSQGTAYGSEVTFTTYATNPVPPTVTTAAVTNVGQNSATSGGEVTANGGAPVTARGVCWNITGSPTIADPHTTDGSGIGPFNSLITGLNINTPYFVRAYATNSAGSAYGNEETFTTTGLQTILAAGDIAFLAYQTDNPDKFAFVFLVDVLGGTEVKFTDNAWTGSALASNEGIDVYSVPAGGLPKGSVIQVDFTTTPPTVTGGGSMVASGSYTSLSTSGDNLIAFQGPSSSPTFIAALASNSWITSGSTSTNTSYLPTGLTDALNAISFPTEMDNGYYNNIVTTGSQAVLLAAINDSANWERSDAIQTWPTFSIIVTGGGPSVPTVTTAAVTNIAQTTATGGGNVVSDGGSAITARGVCWSQLPGPTVGDSHTTEPGTTGVFTSNMTGLDAGTPYYVRAYASNSVGTAYGSEVTFTTLPAQDTIPPIVINGFAFDASHVKVIFNEQVNATAENTANYTGLGTVTSAVRNTANDTVTLTLGTALTYGTMYTLTIQNVQDLAGNAMAHAQASQIMWGVPPAPHLVITEIMYNPPESGTDSLEFIEIYNNDVVPVDLAGYHFSLGVVYNFPSVIMNPGDYFVVAVKASAMLHTFGVVTYQWTSGGLSNSGEAIVIKDSYGSTVDSVYYKNVAPWPLTPNGQGPSLTLCDPDLDNNDGANWSASTEYKGMNTAGDSLFASPGAACTPLGYPVTGTVTYLNTAATPLDSVTVVLIDSVGNAYAQVVTDASGNFEFPVVPTGNWIIMVSTNKVWGGGSSVDALLIMKQFVGMGGPGLPLTGLKYEAGDVTGTFGINSQDALAVARRFVGQITSFPAGDWVFDMPSFTVTATSTNVVSIKGLCMGDVNASFIPFK